MSVWIFNRFDSEAAATLWCLCVYRLHRPQNPLIPWEGMERPLSLPDKRRLWCLRGKTSRVGPAKDQKNIGNVFLDNYLAERSFQKYINNEAQYAFPVHLCQSIIWSEPLMTDSSCDWVKKILSFRSFRSSDQNSYLPVCRIKKRMSKIPVSNKMSMLWFLLQKWETILKMY